MKLNEWQVWTPWGLPRTGQITDFETGDDGDVRAGAPVPGGLGGLGSCRCVDMGDGTVFDYSTGLMWVFNPSLIVPSSSGFVLSAKGGWDVGTSYSIGDLVSLAGGDLGPFYICILGHTGQEPPNATYWVETEWVDTATEIPSIKKEAWVDGFARIAALDYCGYTDWRMPNILELTSIFNYGTDEGPWMHWHPDDTSNRIIWSSTTRANVMSRAYQFRFEDGGFGSTEAKTSANTGQHWPVRGGFIRKHV